MIKIYYNPTNGEIKRVVSSDNITIQLGSGIDLPYIIHPTKIKMCDYQVNLETKQLEFVPREAVSRGR
jgi:hypothetical protein